MELKPVSPTAEAPAQNFTGDVYVRLTSPRAAIRPGLLSDPTGVA